MIQEAERAERNAANEAARRRHAYCNAKYRRSHALNEEAIRLGGDPEAAIAKVEAALANLGDCGSRKDLAILRRNLDNMRRDVAKLTRPSETGIVGGLEENRRWRTAAELMNFAHQACAQIPESSPNRTACIRRNVAEQAMMFDAKARAACQSLPDIEVRNQCLFNRYFARVHDKDPNQFSDPSNCYWDEYGKPCHGRPVATAARPATTHSNRLRDELRDKISNLPDQIEEPSVQQMREAEIARAKAVRDSLPPGPERDNLTQLIDQAEARMGTDTAAAAAPPEAVPAAEAAPPSPTPKTAVADPDPAPASTDDTYQNYMQSRNRHSGGTNSGDLQMQGGVRAGVPDRGSFANDFGGDALLGSPVPSRR